MQALGVAVGPAELRGVVIQRQQQARLDQRAHAAEALVDHGDVRAAALREAQRQDVRQVAGVVGFALDGDARIGLLELGVELFDHGLLRVARPVVPHDEGHLVLGSGGRQRDQQGDRDPEREETT